MANLRWKKPVDGDFADAKRWKGGVVPGPGDDAILNAAGAAFTVTSNAYATVAKIEIASNATLAIDRGQFAVSAAVNAGVIDVAGRQTALVAQGLINNTGAIDLSGSHASLIVGADGLDLTGAGQLNLGALGTSAVFTVAGGSLGNVDNTISGAGLLGDGQLRLFNDRNGVIDATGAANAMIIDTGVYTLGNFGLIETTGAAGMTITATTISNSGTVQASGAGALVLSAVTVDNAGEGVVLVGAGHQAILKNSTLTGGFLDVVGGATLTIASGTNAIAAARFVNDGQVAMASGAVLNAQGILRNNGAVVITGGGHTSLIVGAAGLALTGGGTVTLTDNANSEITGAAAADSLTNFDNTIAGAGQLGGGQMTLTNAAKGVIDATGAVNALIIDVGLSTVVNAGHLEATGAAGCVVESAVSNGGLIEALGGHITFKALVSGMGSAVIAKATLDFEAGFDQDVAFRNRGTLVLAQSQGYTAQISGFSAAGTMTLDLRDIGFVGATEASFSGTSTSGVLTVTDGTHTAQIHLNGDYLGVTFVASGDGRGGTDVMATSGAPSAPPHRFLAAMAGLGGSAGEPVHLGQIWTAREAALARPHAIA